MCIHVLKGSFANSAINSDPDLRLSPENGNVAFASTDLGWCFTLRSFAQMYADTYGQSTCCIFLGFV